MTRASCQPSEWLCPTWSSYYVTRRDSWAWNHGTQPYLKWAARHSITGPRTRPRQFTSGSCSSSRNAWRQAPRPLDWNSGSSSWGTGTRRGLSSTCWLTWRPRSQGPQDLEHYEEVDGDQTLKQQTLKDIKKKSDNILTCCKFCLCRVVQMFGGHSLTPNRDVFLHIYSFSTRSARP